MAKKIEGYINLQVPAGQANPSPPIGPALGQRGLAIMEFCKQFNAKTQGSGAGRADPGEDHGLFGPLLHLRDATPPASYFLKKAAKINGGSKEPGRAGAGTITMAQVREVAKVKMKDLNTEDLEAAARTSPARPGRWACEVVE